MKKLIIALVVSVILIIGLAPLAYANDPGLSIEWDGDSACGVEYGVAGSVETCDSFTKFSTTGADIFGDFDAIIDDDEVNIYFDANVDNGDLACAEGTIDYFSATGCEESGLQTLAAFAKVNDGEASMEIDQEIDECGEIDDADVSINVDACKGALGFVACIEPGKDNDPILAVAASGKNGFDADLDAYWDGDDNEVEAEIDLDSDEGSGKVTLFGASDQVELGIDREEIEVSGSILLDICYNGGVDLDEISMGIEY